MKLALPIALAGLAALLPAACLAVEDPTMTPRLECRMSLPAQLAAGAPAELRFRLKNAGPAAVAVLTWQTPFEGVFAPMLRITRDGRELSFQGPLMKRGEPEAAEYLRLAPGQGEEAVLELAPAWDVAAPGRYRVEYVGRLLDVAPGDAALPRPLAQHRAQALDCPAVAFERLP